MYFSWIWKVRFFGVKIHFPSKNWAETIDFWQISTILWSKLKIRPPSKQKRAKCAGADNPGNNILSSKFLSSSLKSQVSKLMSDMNIYNTPTWNYQLFKYLWRTKISFKTVEILKYYGYGCLQKKFFANFAQITSFKAKSSLKICKKI